jgi:hypothetical protein
VVPDVRTAIAGYNSTIKELEVRGCGGLPAVAQAGGKSPSRALPACHQPPAAGRR